MGPSNTVSHGHGALAGSQSDIGYPILKTAQLFNMLDRLKQIDHTGKETDTTVYFQGLLSRLRPYKNFVDKFLQGNLHDKKQVETLGILFQKSFNSAIQMNIYNFLFHKVEKANTGTSKNEKIPQTEINGLKAFLDPLNVFLVNRQTPLSKNDLKNLRDLNSLEKISAAIDIAINSADSSEAIRVLVIKRAWQITGEYLKNTEDSPHMSDSRHTTIDKLFNRKSQLISDIRNELSHANTLMHHDNTEYINSIPELEKINAIVKKLIYREKFKSMISLIAGLPNISQSRNDIESVIDHDIMEISEGRQLNFKEVRDIIKPYFTSHKDTVLLILDGLTQLHINVIANSIPKIDTSGLAGGVAKIRGRHEIRDTDRKTISVISMGDITLEFLKSHFKSEDKSVDKIYNLIEQIITDHKDQTKRAGNPRGRIQDIEQSIKILEATKRIYDNKKSLRNFFIGKSPDISKETYNKYIKDITDAASLFPKKEEIIKTALNALENHYDKMKNAWEALKAPNVQANEESKVDALNREKALSTDAITRLNKVYDPLYTFVYDTRRQGLSIPANEFYKILSLPSVDGIIFAQFKQLEKTICIDHFNEQLKTLQEILSLGENSNVAGYLNTEKKEKLIFKYEQNSQFKEALNFLLLDLNDTFLELEVLHELQGQHKEGLEKILSGNEKYLTQLRNYLAHGDDVKDLLRHNFQDLIIDNALQLINKGETLINIMQRIGRQEARLTLTVIITDFMGKVKDREIKQKYQHVLTRLSDLNKAGSVPSLSSKASKNIIKVLKYEIAGSVLFNDQKNFQYLLGQYKLEASRGSVNPAIDNLIYHNKRTILHLAAELGRERFITIILRESQSLHSKVDDNGRLPIFSAALSGDLGSFNLLLAKLDKTNLRETVDYDLKTVLHYAVLGNNIEIVRALLGKAKTLLATNGALKNFINSMSIDGKKALDFVNSNPELTTLLKNTVGHTDSSGKSTVAQSSTPSCAGNRRKRSGGCQQESGVIRRLDALSEQAQEAHKRIAEVNRKLIQDEISLQHSVV